MRLSFLCLLLILSVLLTTFSLKDTSPEMVYLKRNRVTDSALPVLAGNSTFPVISAQGTIAVDLDSAVILYEKNADYPLLPASTTKILTALVALDYYQLSQVLTVPSLKFEGQRMRLVVGEKLTTESLLYGLLVFSANDAAEVLAYHYPGGREAFVAAMNVKAKELQMQHSYFVNPTGLDNNEHVSTARDMIRLAEVAMRNDVFATIVETKQKTVTDITGRLKHNLANINQLLGTVEGVKGVKTGWTEGARENLVTYVERENKRVLIAVLGSQDRFGETTELINWIFANYTWEDL